jgi:uncharacterized membrane protein SirB2
MSYQLLKHLHLTTVAVTLVLFLLRGYWMMTDSPRMQARWVKIVPHVNDTILLASAIGLVALAWGNPLHQPWIMAKIIGLLAYIGLGTVALKRGRAKSTRIKAYVAALGVFAYIVAVAISKQVVPGLS